MARKFNGYTEILYVRVTKENMAFVSKKAKKAGSLAGYVNNLITRARNKKAPAKVAVKSE